MSSLSTAHSSAEAPANPALEASIAAAIDPWLEHMRWRKDFAEWRQRRIWQEQHQEANLQDIRSALAGKVAGKVFLDLGAGMGGLSVAVMLEFGEKGLDLQAMDYNPEYCNIARLRAQRYDLHLPIVVAAGEQLPYSDDRFDLVTCLDVLEHVQNAEIVLMEIYRVLKPGGIVLTTVPNRRAFRDPHYHLPFLNWLPTPLAERLVVRFGHSKSGSLLQDRQSLSDLNTYTWADFKRMASEVGFSVRDQVYSRLRQGEVRQLRGFRRALLSLAQRSGILSPLYRLYRYGWQGTYQIRLVKPR